MDKVFYSLRIDTTEEKFEVISEILEIDYKDFSNGWIYEIISEESGYFDFINTFLDLLDGKYELLAKSGVNKDDIAIWLVYEYYSQCNLEFRPQDLNRLGENGISLCISCYESGSL